MQIKINGKNYTVNELGFEDLAKMESIADNSIINLFQKKQIFVLAQAFVANVAGCGREEAARLCEQHVLGGGSLTEIYMAFSDAMSNSHFFRKLLEDQNKSAEEKTV